MGPHWARHQGVWVGQHSLELGHQGVWVVQHCLGVVQVVDTHRERGEGSGGDAFNCYMATLSYCPFNLYDDVRHLNI